MNPSTAKRILSPLALLLIPFFGTIFSNQVNWSLFDFIVMGVILGLFGLSIHFVFEKIKQKKLRIILLFLIVLFFLMIWAELAVGIFGSPFAGS